MGGPGENTKKLLETLQAWKFGSDEFKDIKMQNPLLQGGGKVVLQEGFDSLLQKMTAAVKDYQEGKLEEEQYKRQLEQFSKEINSAKLAAADDNDEQIKKLKAIGALVLDELSRLKGEKEKSSDAAALVAPEAAPAAHSKPQELFFSVDLSSLGIITSKCPFFARKEEGSNFLLLTEAVLSLQYYFATKDNAFSPPQPYETVEFRGEENGITICCRKDTESQIRVVNVLSPPVLTQVLRDISRSDITCNGKKLSSFVDALRSAGISEEIISNISSILDEKFKNVISKGESLSQVLLAAFVAGQVTQEQLNKLGLLFSAIHQSELSGAAGLDVKGTLIKQNVCSTTSQDYPLTPHILVDVVFTTKGGFNVTTSEHFNVLEFGTTGTIIGSEKGLIMSVETNYSGKFVEFGLDLSSTSCTVNVYDPRLFANPEICGSFFPLLQDKIKQVPLKFWKYTELEKWRDILQQALDNPKLPPNDFSEICVLRNKFIFKMIRRMMNFCDDIELYNKIKDTLQKLSVLLNPYSAEINLAEAQGYLNFVLLQMEQIVQHPPTFITELQKKLAEKLSKILSPILISYNKANQTLQAFKGSLNFDAAMYERTLQDDTKESQEAIDKVARVIGLSADDYDKEVCALNAKMDANTAHVANLTKVIKEKQSKLDQMDKCLAEFPVLNNQFGGIRERLFADLERLKEIKQQYELSGKLNIKVISDISEDRKNFLKAMMGFEVSKYPEKQPAKVESTSFLAICLQVFNWVANKFFGGKEASAGFKSKVDEGVPEPVAVAFSTTKINARVGGSVSGDRHSLGPSVTTTPAVSPLLQSSAGGTPPPAEELSQKPLPSESSDKNHQSGNEENEKHAVSVSSPVPRPPSPASIKCMWC